MLTDPKLTAARGRNAKIRAYLARARLNGSTPHIDGSDVETVLDTADMLFAEIDRLTAAHATGRREGLEEAARVCDAHQYGADRLLAACQPDTPTKHAHRLAAKSQAAQHCAASIRALIPKDTP